MAIQYTHAFASPKSLRLGYLEDTGFFFSAEHPETTVIIDVGTAMAAALIMLANRVEHFDYLTSLIDHPTAFQEFTQTARQVGLVV